MPEKGHLEGDGAPSAPPAENSTLPNLSHQTTTLSPHQQTLLSQPGLLLGTSSSSMSNGVSLSLPSEPPPSYQAAMGYPAVSLPYPTNPDNSAFPKPPYEALRPFYGHAFPIANHQFPPPPLPAPPPHVIVSRSTQQPQPLQGAATAPRAVSGNCAYCGVGIVAGQTDLCCLICLVILAICTFPIGLLFLCFVPCAIRKRCSHCHRIG